MKKLWMFAIVFSATTAWAGEAAAEQVVVETRGLGDTPVDDAGELGLGLQVGEPFGVTGKLWLSDWSALQASFGVFAGHGGPILSGDYLFQFVRVTTSTVVGFGGYVGLGGALGFGEACHRDFHGHFHCDESVSVAARVPVGGSLYFKGLPIEISLEVAPVVAVLPEPYGAFGGALAGRYYF